MSAAYFSALKYKPWIKVVETDTVPRPRNPRRQRLRRRRGRLARANRRPDRRVTRRHRPHRPARRRVRLRGVRATRRRRAGPGARRDRRGSAPPCAACHGADLRGGEGPPLAGRSPSYLFRQLFDVASGARSGPADEKMKIEVANLDQARMRDLVAYIASLPP